MKSGIGSGYGTRTAIHEMYLSRLPIVKHTHRHCKQISGLMSRFDEIAFCNCLGFCGRSTVITVGGQE